ncbi:MAG: hypothetical protein H6739_25755 [Alphaproteobacteria bacterium]|nr:hypothetical protein [Alphaproteobacteria bacterium]
MKYSFSPPRVCVDFNEMVDRDLVLLSATDTVVDSDGAVVGLEVGLTVHLYMPDVDETGQVDPLVASGRVERNTARDWSAHVRWCCRIDEGVLRLSKADSSRYSTTVSRRAI